MSTVLSILAAVVSAILLVGGLLRVSLWLSDRKSGGGPAAWTDQGSGNYGDSTPGSGFDVGGDCGGGGD